MTKKIKKKSSTFVYKNSPYTKEIQKRINIAEISLGDFAGRMSNDLLKWFSLTAQHWIMLHMVKKGYFRIIRNKEDKRSIFILPSVITIKTFEEFVDRREFLYKKV